MLWNGFDVTPSAPDRVLSNLVANGRLEFLYVDLGGRNELWRRLRLGRSTFARTIKHGMILETQLLSLLFERDGRPRYGTVLWLAGSRSNVGKHPALLSEAVEAGSSLIVAGARPLAPELERILGLKARESFTADEAAELTQPHFITRAPEGTRSALILSGTSDVSQWVEPACTCRNRAIRWDCQANCERHAGDLAWGSTTRSRPEAHRCPKPSTNVGSAGELVRALMDAPAQNLSGA